MAVLIEAYCVVLKYQRVVDVCGGDFSLFKEIVSNPQMCTDKEVVRVGFMDGKDAMRFIKQLQGGGFVYLDGEQSIDIALVDQVNGAHNQCDWLEIGRVTIFAIDPTDGYQVLAARLTGSDLYRPISPEGWIYEGSLSDESSYVACEDVSDHLEFVETRDGLDVYFDKLTGKLKYIGRAY